MEKSYKYLGYFFLMIVPLAMAAFYKTYIVEFPNFSPRNNVFIHVHAFLSVAWITILITQPFLIVNKKFQLHRAIGKASYVIFPLLVLSFIPQVVRLIREDHTNDIFFPVADSVLMISFYTLAIYHRANSAKHMRYMIAMVIVFLFPTIGRIGPILLGVPGFVTQNVEYGFIYLLLISLVFYDRSAQRDFKPYLVALPFFIAHQLVFNFMVYG